MTDLGAGALPGGAVRTFRFPAIDRVVHGVGAVDQVPALVEEIGAQRVMIITGRTLATSTPRIANLERALGDRHRATFPRMSAHAPRAEAFVEVQVQLHRRQRLGVAAIRLALRQT